MHAGLIFLIKNCLYSCEVSALVFKSCLFLKSLLKYISSTRSVRKASVPAPVTLGLKPASSNCAEVELW